MLPSVISQLKNAIQGIEDARIKRSFYRHQAKLLPVNELLYYAAGHGYNPEFAKACRRELRSSKSR